MRHTVLLAALLLAATLATAGSTIDATNRYAYAANAGWMDWRADGTNGAALGQLYCTGYVYAADVGWICLGKGPTNHVQYSNTTASDWGVNHDGAGNLRGFAYAANAGWINFEVSGQPRVDLLTGNLNGYAWSANLGWISLSNAQARVQTDTLDTGPDTEPDGLPDAWEYLFAGNLTALSGGTHDADGDGATDEQEYWANSNPLDRNSVLRITDQRRNGSTNCLTWASSPARVYCMQQVPTPTNGAAWNDCGLGLILPGTGSATACELSLVGVTQRFYRVNAVVPLAP